MKDDSQLELDQPADEAEDFARRMDEPAPSLAREFWEFLREEKKWWLAPLVIVLLLAAGLIVAMGSAAAPFIYTLF